MKVIAKCDSLKKMNATSCKDILIPGEERKWHYFILTSITLYFGGFLIILFGRLLVKLFQGNWSKTLQVTPSPVNRSRKSRSSKTRLSHDMGDVHVIIKDGAGYLVNVKTLTGKVIVSIKYERQVII